MALDGLRGVCALVVVMFHALSYSDAFVDGMESFKVENSLATILTISPLRMFFDGHLAVSVFFVLSGYVLSRNFWQGATSNWLRYYASRGIRLYFPLIASGIFALCALSMKQQITGRGNGILDLSAAGTSPGQLLSNLGLLGLVNAPVNLVWWSLRWEVWFSILLPFLLVGLRIAGFGPQRRFRYAPAVFGVACFIVTALRPMIVQSFEVQDWVFRSIAYIPVFGIGVALAAYEENFRHSLALRSKGISLSLVGVTILCLALRGPVGLWIAKGGIDPIYGSASLRGLTIMGVSLLIVCTIANPTFAATFSKQPAQWLGTRSYSLYLSHLPLLGLCAALFKITQPSLWFVTLSLLVSLAGATLFYRIVEAPSVSLSRKIANRRSSS